MYAFRHSRLYALGIREKEAKSKQSQILDQVKLNATRSWKPDGNGGGW